MKINSYDFCYNNITEDLKNKWFYLFCLESGKVSRINKFIPITKVKFKNHLRTFTNVFEDELRNEIHNVNSNYDFSIFETLEEAQENFNLAKQKEIEKLQDTINAIMKLQEKIRKL